MDSNNKTAAQDNDEPVAIYRGKNIWRHGSRYSTCSETFRSLKAAEAFLDKEYGPRDDAQRDGEQGVVADLWKLYDQAQAKLLAAERAYYRHLDVTSVQPFYLERIRAEARVVLLSDLLREARRLAGP